jgi:hypothetical protein
LATLSVPSAQFGLARLSGAERTTSTNQLQMVLASSRIQRADDTGAVDANVNDVCVQRERRDAPAIVHVPCRYLARPSACDHYGASCIEGETF